MKTPNLHEKDQWPYIVTFLPEDLDESARRTGAFRRARGVESAEALLRMLLAYAVTDFSQKDVAAWGLAAGIAHMSPEAFFYRVANSGPWLEDVLGKLLMAEVAPVRGPGMRVRLVDATALSGPAATGTDWRIHVVYDGVEQRVASIQLTDEHGGETLSRYPLQSGDVVLGDRGYGHARGIQDAVASDAHLVVRIDPTNIRLCDERRRKLDLAAIAPSIPATGAVAIDVQVPIPPEKDGRAKPNWATKNAAGWVAARVLAGRTREGEVIWVLTTLTGEAADAAEVLDLYRFRWQIELCFKRWKSLLDLDELRTRKGPTAKPWILAKLLAAVLADKLLAATAAFSPWGYVMRNAGALAVVAESAEP